MNKIKAFAIVAALFMSVGASKLSGPHIVSSSRYHIDDCPGTDPLSPCEGERVVFENPWLVPALLTVGCGVEYDEQEIRIPGRTRLTVEIELTIPTRHPACSIKKAVKAQ